jgi:hypothetical protein
VVYDAIDVAVRVVALPNTLIESVIPRFERGVGSRERLE